VRPDVSLAQALDATRRLPNESNPAISFDYGQKAYSWWGVPVPDWVIKRRRMITIIIVWAKVEP